MTKQEIIEKLAKEKYVEGILSNIAITKDDTLKDLSQLIYMDLLQKDEDKITGLYERDELNFFVTRMILNEYFSQNSPYYTQLKKFYNNSNPIEDAFTVADDILGWV